MGNEYILEHLEAFNSSLVDFINRFEWVERGVVEVCDILNFAALIVGVAVCFLPDEYGGVCIYIDDDAVEYLPLILDVFKKNYVNWGLREPLI